jgi:hypothetical protein
MNSNHIPSSSKQIRNLLIVILVSILCAGYLAVTMIYHYGPSGRYLVSNILLAPETLPLLSYKESSKTTGKQNLLVFSDIEFAYWLSKPKSWQLYNATIASYQQMYEIIKNDSSVGEPADEVKSRFQSSPPATLTLRVRNSEANKSQQSKGFQAIQFASDSDYYRIELHGEQTAISWIYFYHPGIYHDAIALFLPELSGGL